MFYEHYVSETPGVLDVFYRHYVNAKKLFVSECIRYHKTTDD